MNDLCLDAVPEKVWSSAWRENDCGKNTAIPSNYSQEESRDKSDKSSKLCSAQASIGEGFKPLSVTVVAMRHVAEVGMKPSPLVLHVRTADEVAMRHVAEVGMKLSTM